MPCGSEDDLWGFGCLNESYQGATKTGAVDNNQPCSPHIQQAGSCGREAKAKGAGVSYTGGLLCPATEGVVMNLSLYIETSRVSPAYAGLEEEA